MLSDLDVQARETVCRGLCASSIVVRMVIFTRYAGRVCTKTLGVQGLRL